MFKKKEITHIVIQVSARKQRKNVHNEFRSVIYVTRSVHSVSMCVYTVCNTHNTPACVYAICINLRKFLFEIAIDCGAKIGDFWWIDTFFYSAHRDVWFC